jgi:hypothetical protein
MDKSKTPGLERARVFCCAPAYPSPHAQEIHAVSSGTVGSEDHPRWHDFGDSWEHLVKLEKRTPGGDQDHAPVCLAGENAAPLDDMGGIYGYYHWLEALHKPGSEMHREARMVLGKDFDPAHFDLKEVNWRLSMEFKQAPKKSRKGRNKRD